MSRTVYGWTPAPKKPPEHGGIGHNGGPGKYDFDGKPFGVLRDIAAFATHDGTEIDGRAALKDYQRKHQVEQCGLESTADSDRGGKPHYFDDYKSHRKECERAAAKGKATPPKFRPQPKPKKKQYPLIAGGPRGGYDKKTRQWSKT